MTEKSYFLTYATKMAVLFSQKQHDDYSGGALQIAIYCNTKLYVIQYYCNLCLQSNLLNALHATIPLIKIKTQSQNGKVQSVNDKIQVLSIFLKVQVNIYYFIYVGDFSSFFVILLCYVTCFFFILLLIFKFL